MKARDMTHTQLTESKLSELDQVVCKLIRGGQFNVLEVLVKTTSLDRNFVLSWAAYTSLFPKEVSHRVYMDMSCPSFEEAQTFTIAHSRMLKIIERAQEPKPMQIG